MKTIRLTHSLENLQWINLQNLLPVEYSGWKIKRLEIFSVSDFVILCEKEEEEIFFIFTPRVEKEIIRPKNYKHLYGESHICVKCLQEKTGATKKCPERELTEKEKIGLRFKALDFTTDGWRTKTWLKSSTKEKK